MSLVSQAPMTAFDSPFPPGAYLPLSSYTSYTPVPPSSQPASSLGSATALGQPRWVDAPAPMRAPISRVLRVPRTLLDLMADAADATGISERDIWIEAARLWLRAHSVSDEPPPSAPAALANPRRARTWANIDAILADLRHEPLTETGAAIQGRTGSDSAA